MSGKKYAVDLPAPETLQLSQLLEALDSGMRRALLKRLLRGSPAEHGLLEHPRHTFDPISAEHTVDLHALRYAGWVHQRPGAEGLLTRLRRDDLDLRFPGLLDYLDATLDDAPTRATRARQPQRDPEAGVTRSGREGAA